MASNAELNELTGKQEAYLDFLSHCTDKELVELPREVTHLDTRHIAQVVVDKVVASDGHKEHRPLEEVGCRRLPESQR